MSLTHDSRGITLGPEQGELAADFPNHGTKLQYKRTKIRPELTFALTLHDAALHNASSHTHPTTSASLHQPF